MTMLIGLRSNLAKLVILSLFQLLTKSGRYKTQKPIFTGIGFDFYGWC